MPPSGTRVVLVDGVRTPYCRANTDLRDVSAADLGRAALVELFARTGFDPVRLDEVIFGNIATPADSANIARVIALRSGVPRSVPAFTVGRNCGSGAESIADAFLRIQGFNDAVAAGGVESMPQIPLLFSGESEAEVLRPLRREERGRPARRAPSLSPVRFPADRRPRVRPDRSRLRSQHGTNGRDPCEGIPHHARGAGRLALRSHQRAAAARAKLAEEIVPVPLPPDYGRLAVQDNGIRENQTMGALAKLKPYFDRKFGTVTAGNSSQITDGGAATLVMSEEAARGLGLKPLGRILSFGFAGTDPARMGLGPVVATPLALKRAGVAWKDVGLLEINEAFAAQVLACAKAWSSADWAKKNGLDGPIGELDFDRTNVNGGAIALGHPVGSSGTRLVLTLLKEMRRRNVPLGVATMCIGGGQGGAVVVEAV